MSEFDFTDINLDFLQSSPPRANGSQGNERVATPCIKSDFAVRYAGGKKTKTKKQFEWAKKIANTDELLFEIKKLKCEKLELQTQLKDLQQSAFTIQNLYSIEKNSNAQKSRHINSLEAKLERAVSDLTHKNFICDQLKGQLGLQDDRPIEYNELVVKYMKLCSKVDEENFSKNSTDQTFMGSIKLYCAKNKLKVPAPSSPKPPKSKRIQKIHAEVQCDLLKDHTPAKKPAMKCQSTQCKTEMRSKGCQHISTMTTRGTTTACFIKYRSVGTIFPDPQIVPVVDDILKEFAPWHNIKPLSPLSDQHFASSSRSRQNTIKKFKSIGTCTWLCNVRRQIDFIPRNKQQRSNNACNVSTSSSIKEEITTPSPSPTPNIRTTMGSNQNMSAEHNATPNVTTNPSIVTNPLFAALQTSLPLRHLNEISFDGLWQIFGRMLWGLFQTSNAGIATNNQTSSANNPEAVNQNHFNSWLRELYENSVSASAGNASNEQTRVQNTHNMASSPINLPTSEVDNVQTINSRSAATSPLHFNQISPNVIRPQPRRNNVCEDFGYNEENTIQQIFQTPAVLQEPYNGEFITSSLRDHDYFGPTNFTNENSIFLPKVPKESTKKRKNHKTRNEIQGSRLSKTERKALKRLLKTGKSPKHKKNKKVKLPDVPMLLSNNVETPMDSFNNNFFNSEVSDNKNEFNVHNVKNNVEIVKVEHIGNYEIPAPQYKPSNSNYTNVHNSDDAVNFKKPKNICKNVPTLKTQELRICNDRKLNNNKKNKKEIYSSLFGDSDSEMEGGNENDILEDLSNREYQIETLGFNDKPADNNFNPSLSQDTDPTVEQDQDIEVFEDIEQNLPSSILIPDYPTPLQNSNETSILSNGFATNCSFTHMDKESQNRIDLAIDKELNYIASHQSSYNVIYEHKDIPFDIELDIELSSDDEGEDTNITETTYHKIEEKNTFPTQPYSETYNSSHAYYDISNGIEQNYVAGDEKYISKNECENTDKFKTMDCAEKYQGFSKSSNLYITTASIMPTFLQNNKNKTVLSQPEAISEINGNISALQSEDDEISIIEISSDITIMGDTKSTIIDSLEEVIIKEKSSTCSKEHTELKENKCLPQQSHNKEGNIIGKIYEHNVEVLEVENSSQSIKELSKTNSDNSQKNEKFVENCLSQEIGMPERSELSDFKVNFHLTPFDANRQTSTTNITDIFGTYLSSHATTPESPCIPLDISSQYNDKLSTSFSSTDDEISVINISNNTSDEEEENVEKRNITTSPNDELIIDCDSDGPHEVKRAEAHKSVSSIRQDQPTQLERSEYANKNQYLVDSLNTSTEISSLLNSTFYKDILSDSILPMASDVINDDEIMIDNTTTPDKIPQKRGRKRKSECQPEKQLPCKRSERLRLRNSRSSKTPVEIGKYTSVNGRNDVKINRLDKLKKEETTSSKDFVETKVEAEMPVINLGFFREINDKKTEEKNELTENLASRTTLFTVESISQANSDITSIRKVNEHNEITKQTALCSGMNHFSNIILKPLNNNGKSEESPTIFTQSEEIVRNMPFIANKVCKESACFSPQLEQLKTPDSNNEESTISSAPCEKNDTADNNLNTTFNYPESPASPSPSDEETLNTLINSATFNIPLELSPKYRPKAQSHSLVENLMFQYSATQSKLMAAKAGSQNTENYTKSEKNILMHYEKVLEEYCCSTMQLDPDIQAIKALKTLQQFRTIQYSILCNALLKLAKTAEVSELKDFELPSIVQEMPPRHLSRSLQRIFYLLKHLQSIHCTFSKDLMLKIDATLFNIQQLEKTTLNGSVHLIQLYLMACKYMESSFEQNPARFLIAKCLYFHNCKATSMIYEILMWYPTVLPPKEDRTYDRSDALITVIQQMLMSTKYDMENRDLRGKSLLSKLRYEYHFEPFKPSLDDTISNLIEKLKMSKFCNLNFAFSLLCKRMSPTKTVNILNSDLLPLANEYFNLALKSTEYDERISQILDIISKVVKPLPTDFDIEIYLNLFSRFLSNFNRPIIQESAICSIIRMQRFGYVNCFHRLLSFKPTFELSANTQAMLKTFIHRKPFAYLNIIARQGKAILS